MLTYSAYSNKLNQCRLSSLKAREDAIHGILAEAQGKLVSLTKDEGDYKELLEKLVLQVIGFLVFKNYYFELH